MFILSAMAMGKAVAFEQITAQEAYNMVEAGTAKLIDVRTTAEYVWVGTCKLSDGTTPYNIPWKIWVYQFSETDGKVTAGGIVVKTIFATLIEKIFPDKDTPLILMCRSGKRTDDAAAYLDSLGYNMVYEIDRPGVETGHGGFQGSSHDDPSDKGYRGWPGRVGYDESVSCSWMDTGLPMTQTVDKDKIWMYMWK
jgi:rhodanese-related sulfurtransferase